MTQTIFIVAWFIAMIAFFFAAGPFLSWWSAQIRGAEPRPDDLGKALFGAGIFVAALAMAFAAGLIGDFVEGGW